MSYITSVSSLSHRVPTLSLTLSDLATIIELRLYTVVSVVNRYHNRLAYDNNKLITLDLENNIEQNNIFYINSMQVQYKII